MLTWCLMHSWPVRVDLNHLATGMLHHLNLEMQEERPGIEYWEGRMQKPKGKREDGKGEGGKTTPLSARTLLASCNSESHLKWAKAGFSLL